MPNVVERADMQKPHADMDIAGTDTLAPAGIFNIPALASTTASSLTTLKFFQDFRMSRKSVSKRCFSYLLRHNVDCGFTASLPLGPRPGFCVAISLRKNRQSFSHPQYFIHIFYNNHNGSRNGAKMHVGHIQKTTYIKRRPSS